MEKKKPLNIAYLIKTIRNLHIDQKRKKLVRFKWLNTQKKPKSYLQKVGVEPVLEKLLDQLKDRDREILLLSIVEEYTAKEIGELMDISRNTVLSILSRTKKKLKEALKENEIERK